MKEYKPKEIEARKEMYRQIKRAYRCAHKLDEDGMEDRLFLALSAVCDSTEGLDFVFELQRIHLSRLDNDGIADFEKDIEAMKEYVRENGTAVLYLGKYVDSSREMFGRRIKERDRTLSLAMDAASKGQIRSMYDIVEKVSSYKPLTDEENVDLRHLLLKGFNKRNKEMAIEQRTREKERILNMRRLVAVGA